MNKEYVYEILGAHYRQYYDQMVRRVNRYLQNMYNSEDIVQEAYTRAFKYWEAFPDDGNIDKWVNSIIANCSRDFHKQEILRGMSDAAEASDIIVDAAGLPAYMTEQIISRIWSKEPPLCDMLYFALIQQWKPREIVEAGKADTEGQVRQNVHRFRKEIIEDFKLET